MADEKIRKRKRRVIKLRRFFGLFVLILIVAVVGLNWDYLSPEAIMLRIERMGSLTGKTVEYPIDTTGKVIRASGRLGNQGFVVTDSGYYRLSGNKAEEFSHSLQSVALSTAGDYALLYEKGGNDFIIESASGRVAERTSESVIQLAEIAPNGSYALLVKVTEYASKLLICSSSGKELFSNLETSSKITGITFNNKASLCAVTSVDTAGGGMVSAVTIYDLSGEKEPVFLKQTDLLDVSAAFDSEGRLCVICDQAIVFYGTDLKQSAREDYRGRTLLSYAWSEGRVALLFQTDDPLSGRVAEVYQNGKLLYSVSTDRKAKGIALQGNKMALLDKDQLLVYDKNELMMSVPAPAGSVRTLLTEHDVFEIDQNQVVSYPLAKNSGTS